METKKLVWNGESMGPVRVDRWNDAQYVYKTIAIHVYNFGGSVLIEGSLMVDPSDNDWFTYWQKDYTNTATTDSPYQNTLLNRKDTVIWLRATITPSDYGRVDRIIVL